MATSNVAIVNRALQKLGAKTISAFTQDHPNARVMSLAFAPVRDALLREYDWNFAIKRVSIAAVTGGDAYEGLNLYQLPNDFARLLREQFTYDTNLRKDWQIEGGYIVTADGAPLRLRYIARIEDPVLFDASFVELLSARLALETCTAITESTAKKQDLKEDSARALAEARRVNSFENYSRDPQEDEWIQIMR